MAMGKRGRQRQENLFIASNTLVKSPGHPFYEKLNQVLGANGFDEFVEGLCQRYYAPHMGRKGIPPGVYFRMLLIGYFEGLDSERGIEWRVSDSLTLRRFLGYALDEQTPDHSSLSRIRHRLPLEVHEAVFKWILRVLCKAGLVKGKTLGVDATTLEANAAMRSIVRRDTGEGYQAFLENLAKASGIETPKRLHRQRIREVVADKGYHSNDVLTSLKQGGIRSYISEPDRGRRKWNGRRDEQAAVYANRRRIKGDRGKALRRSRAERVERTIAHTYDTGGMRRLHLRDRGNILKRLLIHIGGCNLALLMRKVMGVGTPKALQDLAKALQRLLLVLQSRLLPSVTFLTSYQRLLLNLLTLIYLTRTPGVFSVYVR